MDHLDRKTLTRIKKVGKASRKSFLTQLKGLKSEKAKKRFLWLRCATDVELFAALYFAHYCTDPFNDFHRDSFKVYEFAERAVRRADAAPRGYAKSVLKALIKPIHDLCYGLEKFIVIISNTDDQSVQKLKDIRAELLENDRLIDAYGPFLRNRRAGETDFVADSSGHKVRFLALGFKKEIRGIRFGNARPSKIICDDLEHSEEVDNEALRVKYSNRYQDVVSKIGDRNTNIEVIGTVLHRKALLVDLLNNPRYRGRTYKSILSWAERTDLWDQWKEIYTNLDDEERAANALTFFEANRVAMLQGTKVLWPEREPYYALQEEIIESGLRSFMKEKQNSPMSDEDKVFDPESFRYFKEGIGPHPVTKQSVPGLIIEKTGAFIPLEELECFAVIDPATGQEKPKKNKKGDFTCILWGYAQVIQGKKKRLFVVGDHTRRIAPSKYIKKVFDIHELMNFVKLGVETNLYRNLLLPNMVDERKRREKAEKRKIILPMYDIEQVENKHKRIYTLEPRVENGWILFSRMLSQEFFDQMWDFPKADHDDCPDALEMLWALVHNRFKPAAISMGVMDR